MRSPEAGGLVNFDFQFVVCKIFVLFSKGDLCRKAFHVSVTVETRGPVICLLFLQASSFNKRTKAFKELCRSTKHTEPSLLLTGLRTRVSFCFKLASS